jgi:2-iminobutanoate/2-iminopropanoate deaminase
MIKQAIYTDKAPKPLGALSQAIKVGNTVYLAGQVGFDPQTMAVVSSDFAEQAHQTFKNLRAVAQAAGGDLDNIVKVNAYVLDVGHFALFNEIMSGYFSPPYPARATLGIAGLPKGAVIEVEAVMVI